MTDVHSGDASTHYVDNRKEDSIYLEAIESIDVLLCKKHESRNLR